MNKKPIILSLALALSVGSLASGALAFSDLDQVPGQEKIVDLQKRGIVNGVDKDHFAPQRILTTEQAVSMIVKGLDLNLDTFNFIKKPEASDSFTKIPNDAWYAQAFVIAHLHGLPLDRDIKPGVPITREHFVDLLMNAVNTKGPYPMIKIYINVEDSDKVSDGRMGSIQNALIAKIAELDDHGKFRPQEPITRAEAAVMLHNAIQFVKQHEEQQPDEGQQPPVDQPENPYVNEKVDMAVSVVNDDIQKVTLTWGEKPNPGYGISIVGIDFTSEDKAVVKYQLRFPEPGKMYAQVIVNPEASAYVGSNIKHIELRNVDAPSIPLKKVQ
ncbi:S-layer homology domain-containing protein [Paenibacillus thermotolerans]|uniref:S-layer homology domain-containing protein n=1 Tax=Paenibacillus thermotolerans TaxID=3027807 RepID=UPI00236787C7|nr:MULTISPECIES: S-layer homology domain-containing protein [unclassified Paenibacillus]